MATVLKGVDGSITIDAVTLAVTAWSFNYARNLVATTEVGDNDETNTPTLGSGGGSITFNLKDEEDTQNKLLLMFTASGTPAAVAVVLTCDTGATFAFNANLENIDTSISPEGIYALTCSFKVTGGVTAIPPQTVSA